MASKNISIREDLYAKLTKLKGKDQSYSEFIEQLLDEGLKGSFSRLIKYFGCWDDLPDEVFDEMSSVRTGLNKSVHDRITKRMDDIE